MQRRLQIFLLVSFQVICAALSFVTSYVTSSFQSLCEQLCRISLDSMIDQLDKISLSLNQFGSTIRQLDLSTSLSLQQLGSTDSRSQLQNKFQTEQLVQQQLSGNTALATQLQHNNNKHIELEKKSFAHPQLQSNFKIEQQNKQLQEQSASDKHLRQLHLLQLHDQDQPFSGPKQLPKESCFTSCLFSKMISSFSKQKLGRLHLTRSILELDEHYKQLSHKHSTQLCEHHLQATSFHRNKQQQQLFQQSFDNKMKKKQLNHQGSQLGSGQPTRAYSSMSLQQLTRRNALQRFELPGSTLLIPALVAFSLVVYQHKSFQLTLQQLCLSKAQGGELQGAFPPACCTTRRLPALTLMSLSFAVARFKSFPLSLKKKSFEKVSFHEELATDSFKGQQL